MVFAVAQLATGGTTNLDHRVNTELTSCADVPDGRAALRRHVRSRAPVSTVPAWLLDNTEIVDEEP